MSRFIPWGWHMLSFITLILYAGFFVVYNDEITSPGSPGAYEFGDTDTGDDSWLSTAWDVITFGAFNEQVTLPELLSIAMFLMCGIWWVLILLDILVTAIDILIPG